MVFFPSYRFLEEVFARVKTIQNETKKLNYLVQEPSMGEDRREAFLKEFEKDIDGSLVGFCVMGGIFSEGIDLAEDRLIGAVIVGTGLPQVCVERELLRRYFDEKNASGFDYAYIYPGVNKVMQSAGRVIRTEKDRGVIVLLDSRFGGAGYNGIFPKEWSDIRKCRLENISKYLDDFWHNEKNKEK